jgi:ABC-2 type transport system ATP-binding protein
MVEGQELVRSYGALRAVDGISFAVHPGEIYGFLGPNGAGKTTTIRMFTGLTRPDAGTARVGGMDVWKHLVEVKRRIGVVPERSNLYDELTCQDNLVFVAQLYGLSRRHWHARARELLVQFGLLEKQATPFGKLSRGMKRRLTIAAALVHEPEAIFLDEPTTGLDVMSALSLRALIRKLGARGTTVFLTTHNIEEAGQLCQRIAILVKGRIVTVDTPENLRAAAEQNPAIEVTLRQPASTAATLLLGLPGVTGVEARDHTLRVMVTSPEEALPPIVSTLDQHGTAIVALSTVRPSLEEAFVRLTGLKADSMLTGTRGEGR